MYTYLLTFCLFMVAATCYGQTKEKSIYKNLKIIRESTFEDVKNCRPCILEEYDKNNSLIRKAVRYGDCIVGFYQEYYPNGQLKIQGQAKENASGSWENAYNRGLCMARTGEWVFFTEKGEVIKKEIWKDGDFIKEIPEQTENEVWKVELYLHNQKLEREQPVSFNEINSLKVVPFFKNKARAGINLTDTLEISSLQKVPIKIKFTDGLLDTNIKDLMLSHHYDLSKTIFFQLTVYNNKEFAARFFWKVKQ